jgi:hypothetical protein
LTILLLLLLQIGTAGTFDAEAYRQSLAANVALQQQIKEKRHGSAAQEGEQAWRTAASTHFAARHCTRTSVPTPSMLASNSCMGSCRSLPNTVCPLLPFGRCCHAAGGCGGNSGSSCPFATIGGDEVKQQWQRTNYHAKHVSKNMADKVSVVLLYM